MMDFTGQTALITGASGAIGGACAKFLHKLGANIVISGTNQAKLDALYQELGEQNCAVQVCNLADLDACQNLVNSIGKLDILVCNAGITDDRLSMMMSIESFQKVIDINLTASFALNKAAIVKMMKARYGRIINITSVVAFNGNPGQANYCASKAGLTGMSKSLAQEVAKRGITINCIAPGFIESDMTNKLSQEHKTALQNKIPMDRLGKPEDIAPVVAFLASSYASYITGTTIHVNGGMLMI